MKVLVIGEGLPVSAIHQLAEKAEVVMIAERKLPMIDPMVLVPCPPVPELYPERRRKDRRDPTHPRNAFKKRR